VAQAVTGFAEWLAADLSATQLRLRALPDLSASAPEDDGELELAIIDYTPPAPPPTPAASVEAAAAPAAAAVQAVPVVPVLAPVAARSAPGKVTSIDPSLERHFQALRAQPITLYAQQLEPLTDASRIPRYEILLRTGSEHGRTQAPVAMLEAAARKGLGSVLDRRVITDLVVWLSRSTEAWSANPISVTVNLSSTSLVDAHFLKFLEACLTKSGMPRGMIGFELDASVCAQQRQRSTDFAEVLASLGCKLVLDNFSLQEGHVELLDLKGLRMLKLHPQLTNTMAIDTRRQAVVAGIAQMARVLGMYSCAKAVESKQIQPLLAKLGVDFAQGFAYSVPRPLAELGFGEQAVAAAR
jgi:EAL domain-containing protein (putative c-di-GMP-specific phosphodiesterase class I)